jgi:very-short-patch-repair endonuclease
VPITKTQLTAPASGIIQTSLGLAAGQHGVVSRSQLIRAGIPRTSIDRQIGSALFPLFPSVYAVGRPTITQDGLWAAGVLCGGGDAAIGYRSAAALWGFLRRRPAVDIIRPRHRMNCRALVDIEGSRSMIPLNARRTRSLPAHHVREVRGIPVTSVSRTLLDLASVLGPKSLERAFLEADRLGLIRDEELMEIVGRANGHRGAGNLLRLVEGRIPDLANLRSVLEGMFLALCRDESIERPETNVMIGPFEVDCVWRAQRLVVELDGYEFHRGLEKLERDADRMSELRAQGWSTMRLTWRMVAKKPELVAARVKGALGSAV